MEPTVTEDRRACPSCRSPMARLRVKAPRLDRCGGCEGLWFDTRELAAYAAGKGVTVLPGLFDRTRAPMSRRPVCPSCAAVYLALVRSGGASLLICNVCDGCFIPGYQMKVFRHRAADPAAAPEEASTTGFTRLILELSQGPA